MTMEGRFEKELFDKILDKEDLNLNELQFLERCIYLSKTYNELLSIQLGLSPNGLGLKYVHKEGGK